VCPARGLTKPESFTNSKKSEFKKLISRILKKLTVSREKNYVNLKISKKVSKIEKVVR